VGPVRFFRRREAAPPPQVQVRAGLVVPDLSEPVEIAGTTTVGAQALAALYSSRGQPEGGLLELPGILVPEPGNSADANAVAVHSDGSRIGYVPAYIAAQLSADRLSECRVQLWAARTEKGLRARGWVAAGSEPVRWPHTTANPPAVTIEERRNEQAAGITRMVDQGLGRGGERAEQFKQGMVGRLH
jgi:hypothetical protein